MRKTPAERGGFLINRFLPISGLDGNSGRRYNYI